MVLKISKKSRGFNFMRFKSTISFVLVAILSGCSTNMTKEEASRMHVCVEIEENTFSSSKGQLGEVANYMNELLQHTGQKYIDYTVNGDQATIKVKTNDSKTSYLTLETVYQELESNSVCLSVQKAVLTDTNFRKEFTILDDPRAVGIAVEHYFAF